MRIPGIKTARALSHWVQARILGGALILGYHRVANVAEDPYDVCLTPENFAEHMEIVRKYANPIALSKLVQRLKAGSMPPRAIAVTFDDGYADNLYQAKPVLERYDVPATVFVCTGYAGREFWWDEVERLVMSSKADLHTLDLQMGAGQVTWDQPHVSRDAQSPDLRRQFRHALYQFLLPLDVDDQNHAMKTIRNWSGVTSDENIAARTMSHTELQHLTDGGMVEIGAHTRHHPMLPRLSLERQRDEITSSKRELEELLGKHVTGFAYPNGRATDDAKRIAQDAGFAFACTSLHNVVRPGSDLYELTRFWQKNVNGDRFMRGLRVWMKTQGNHAL